MKAECRESYVFKPLKSFIRPDKRNVVVVYGSLSLVFAAPLEYLFFSKHTKL
jgi:hypothetical protein